jgi:N-acyl-L-homoserine lactone synthetase
MWLVGRCKEARLSLVQETRSGPAQQKIDLLDQVEYRLAETEVEREEIYNLRYRAYVNEGAIEARSDQRLTDRFDDLPNSWIFGIYLGGELTSSVRISVATPECSDTPAVDAFADLLEPELAKGKVIVDPNRFVADPVRRTKYPQLPYITLRLAYVACEHFGADIGTATVRKEHQAFYRRVFLHQPLCLPRPYPTLTKPLCLMAVDYPKLREKVFQRYPLFRSTELEREMLFERLSSVVDLPEFLGQASMAPTR